MGAQHTGGLVGPGHAGHPGPLYQPLTPDDPGLVAGHRIAARLGVGALGPVYLAYAPGGQPVALTAVRPELAARSGFAAAFEHDVQAVRRVHGPYTVPVLGSGHDGSRYWLAAGYVPALTLHAAVSDTGRPLPVPVVLRLVAGVAEALRAVHHAGVVHAGLGPGTVLLAADGPRVTGYGVTRAAADAPGIPAFSSPEQAADKPPVPATDVFALGQLAAYAAIGTAPFGARAVQEEPDLSELPGELREIVTRCLIKDPALRPSPSQVIAMCAQATHHRAPVPWLPTPLQTLLTLPPPLPPLPPPGTWPTPMPPAAGGTTNAPGAPPSSPPAVAGAAGPPAPLPPVPPPPVPGGVGVPVAPAPSAPPAPGSAAPAPPAAPAGPPGVPPVVGRPGAAGSAPLPPAAVGATPPGGVRLPPAPGGAAGPPVSPPPLPPAAVGATPPGGVRLPPAPGGAAGPPVSPPPLPPAAVGATPPGGVRVPPGLSAPGPGGAASPAAAGGPPVAPPGAAGPASSVAGKRRGLVGGWVVAGLAVAVGAVAFGGGFDRGHSAAAPPERSAATASAPAQSENVGREYRGVGLAAGNGLVLETDPPQTRPGAENGTFGYAPDGTAFVSTAARGALVLLGPDAPGTLDGCRSADHLVASVSRTQLSAGSRLCVVGVDGTTALVTFRQLSDPGGPAAHVTLDLTVWPGRQL